MADWESHREVLKDLYLRQDMTLAKVMEYMAQNHDFQATKAQYESQVTKKWNWRKNLTQSEWEFVHYQTQQRKEYGRESRIYFNDVLIPPKKVEKEFSRHILPTFQQRDVQVLAPQNLEAICIRTPSPIETASLSQKALSSKRKAPAETWQYNKYPKRQAITSLLRLRDVIDGPQTPCQVVVKSDNLPYSQFRDSVSLLVTDFNRIFSSNDGLFRNVCSSDGYPSEQQDTTPDSLISDTGSDDDVLMIYYPREKSPVGGLYEAFATRLLDDGRIFEHSDTLERLLKVQIGVTSLLENMPERDTGEIKHNIEMLLGPPTANAARCFLEIVVYLSTNNLLSFKTTTDSVISWILENVSWANLKSFLRIKLPTTQAFAQIIFESATRLGNVGIVKALLEAEPTLRTLLSSSGSFLFDTTIKGNAELVEVLLNHGANPNKPDVSYFPRLPLHFAPSVRISRLLVDAGAYVNASSRLHRALYTHYSPLLSAAARGSVEMCQYLLKVGADVNGESETDESGMDESDTGLINEYPLTVLVSAINTGNIELLQVLLTAGAKVNATSCPPHSFLNEPNFSGPPYRDQGYGLTTALQEAVVSDNCDVVKFLLDVGADVDALNDGSRGNAALLTATENDNLPLVQLLLEAGARPEILGTSDVEFPRTALLVAVENNSTALVNLLLDAGADVNAPSFGYFGSTALEAAQAQKGSAMIARILTAKGAIVKETPLNGYSLIQFRKAVKMGDLERVRTLLNADFIVYMRGQGTKQIDYELFQGLIAVIENVDEEGSFEFNVELFQVLLSLIEDFND